MARCQCRPQHNRADQASVLVSENAVFLSHFYINSNILPRQARDKHTENSKNGPFSHRLGNARREFNVTTLSLMPRVYSIQELLTDFECDWVMNLGHQLMPVAAGRVAAAGGNDVIWHSRGRTSSQIALATATDSILAKIHT